MSAAKGPTLTTTHEPRDIPLTVAIDGGNSKTEVVILADVAGGGLEELARAIGPGSGAGPDAVVAAVVAVLAEQRVDPSRVVRGSAAVAGLDLPGDEIGHREALARLFPNARIEVVGDAVAVLDAGAGLGHALAIVSGAGLNAVARGPKGLATVPALGWVSGDWGGGDELGREAVRAAARAEDGRGPATRLRELVLAETGAADTIDLARRIRDGAVTRHQVGALAAVVARAAAEGDAVAGELIARAASEAVAIAGVAVRGAWGAVQNQSTGAEHDDAGASLVAPDVPAFPSAIPSVLPGAPAIPSAIPSIPSVAPGAPAIPSAIPSVPPGAPAVPSAIPSVLPGTPAIPSVPPAAPAIPSVPPVPPGTPAVLAGGMFADDTFRALVSDALRAHGFDPRPLAFRPVDGLVRALREESVS